jgi:Fuc2NAc and GlcNAc transferase
VIFAVVAAGVNYFTTGWYLKYAKENHITDIPTKRSSHDVPKPRGGGIGFVIVTILGSIAYLLYETHLFSVGIITFLIALIIVAIFGWFDDKNSLSIPVRFSVQVIAALTILIFLSDFDAFYVPGVYKIPLGIFGFLVGIIWLTGTTNIYNFMDGVDGIASVQAIFAGIGWIFWGWYLEIPFIIVMNLILVCSVGSFLMYNWQPAKIFMGDVGSVFLGFYFATLPFLAVYLSDSLNIGFTIWISALLLWPFLYDGSFTLIRRAVKKKNVFKPHRTHLYQRLNRMGWSHKKVTYLYSAFCLISFIGSIIFVTNSGIIKIFTISVILLLSFWYSHVVYKHTWINNQAGEN